MATLISPAPLDLNRIFDNQGGIMEHAGNADDQRVKTALVPQITAACERGLVSVIIPTFNRSAMVRQALASVIAQTWQNIEIIIVDDGSSDGTFDLLQAWHEKNPEVALNVIRQANHGVASARNLGLSRARGEFLYLLDSDDLIFPDALQTLVNLIRSDNAPYAVANIHCADADGRILNGQKAGISKFSKRHFYLNCWMTHAALYTRSALARSGLFNKSLLAGEDTEFQWRILTQSGEGTATSDYIGVRRQHSFGHLSYNRTDIKCLQHSLQARMAFIDWLNRKNLKIPAIDIRHSIVIFAAAFRFGNAGDWKSKDAAISLYRLMARKPAILGIIGRPNWRTYYSVLLGVYLGLLRVRNFLRSVRNLRLVVQPHPVRRTAPVAE